MAIYTYSSDSLIADIEILTNEKGGSRAYVHARGDASAEDIANMQSSFAAKGWFGVPCQHKGRATLELRGFKKPEELLQHIQGAGFVKNNADVTQTKEDQRSGWEKFKSATLKYTGWTYIAGDAAFMTYAGMEIRGHKQKFKTLDAAHKAVEALHQSPLDDVAKVAQFEELTKLHRPIRSLNESATEVGKAIPKLPEVVKELGEATKAAKGGVGAGWFKIISGLGYGIGSVILAGYGSRDQSGVEIKKSVSKIERFIKTEGLSDPNQPRILAQEPVKKNQNIFDHTNNFLKRYPSEALNFVYTGVGLTLMMSSFGQIKSLGSELKVAQRNLKQVTGAGSTVHPKQLEKLTDTVSSFKKERGTEILDVGLGSITAASALTGILVKEKKPIEGQKKREGLAGAWDWVQEQPLRATGIGYMVATLFHAGATADKWRPNKDEAKARLERKTLVKGAELSEKSSELLKDLKYRRQTVMGRGAFVAANIIAEVLLILSSKGHGEGVRNADVDESVIASTAQFISKQNPATQEQLIQRLAGYMSAPDVLGMKSEDIATNLRTQVASMVSNPWAQAKQPAISAEPAAAGAEAGQGLQATPSNKVHSVQRSVAKAPEQAAAAQNWKDYTAESKQAVATKGIA